MQGVAGRSRRTRTRQQSGHVVRDRRRQGMEETLTVTRLRIDPALAIHLVTTNPIESSFSCVRKLTGRVKRWRGGLMKHRWCATGLLDAERRFRRIKGFSSMHQLIKALDAPVVQEKKIA